MTALLASLASAAFYGAADFLGGLASRRANTIAIVVISQLAGLIVLGLMLPFLPASSPAPNDWIWGAAAGVAGGIGVALLYRALAMGSMAIVAPITAVCAVTVPVAVAIVLGERPGAGAVAGIALAILAIVLVSQQKSPRAMAALPIERARRVSRTALASGVAIGLFFLALAQTSADAGMWPLVAARSVFVRAVRMLAARHAAIHAHAGRRSPQSQWPAVSSTCSPTCCTWWRRDTAR